MSDSEEPCMRVSIFFSLEVRSRVKPRSFPGLKDGGGLGGVHEREKEHVWEEEMEE